MVKEELRACAAIVIIDKPIGAIKIRHVFVFTPSVVELFALAGHGGGHGKGLGRTHARPLC